MESSKDTFAKRLYELLIDKDVPQAHLAKAMGTSPQAISSYVKGKTTPDYDMLCNIADYFDVSIDWLLGRTNVQSSDENTFIDVQPAHNDTPSILREFRHAKDTLENLYKLYAGDKSSLLCGNTLSLQFLASIRAQCDRYNAVCLEFAESSADHPEHCGEFSDSNFTEHLSELLKNDSFRCSDDCSSIISELIRMENYFR